jgi:hypothetical protein
MIERSFFLLGSVCYRMFGIDPRKAGFGANADPGNVCGARNAQFEQGFFDLSPSVRRCSRTTEEMTLAISASRTIWLN